MMQVGWLGLSLSVLATVALAAGPEAVRKRVEASMVVTGTIVVAPDGSVSTYEVDREKKVPAPVLELIGKNAPRWKFEPVKQNGNPVAARAKMSLRVVARPQDDDGRNYKLDIQSVHFGDDGKITFKDRQRPRYPEAALKSRVEGTVYLLLKVDRKGLVVDAIAQQVNLGVIASDEQLDAWRKTLAGSALDTAKAWTFNVAADDSAFDGEYHYARVPVRYVISAIGQLRSDPYGRWQTYVPGPVRPAPWFDRDRMTSGVDALPDDGVYDVGHAGPALLTPLGGA